jgi:hypothetical protein
MPGRVTEVEGLRFANRCVNTSSLSKLSTFKMLRFLNEEQLRVGRSGLVPAIMEFGYRQGCTAQDTLACIIDGTKRLIGGLHSQQTVLNRGSTIVSVRINTNYIVHYLVTFIYCCGGTR